MNDIPVNDFLQHYSKAKSFVIAVISRAMMLPSGAHAQASVIGQASVVGQAEAGTVKTVNGLERMIDQAACCVLETLNKAEHNDRDLIDGMGFPFLRGYSVNIFSDLIMALKK